MEVLEIFGLGVVAAVMFVVREIVHLRVEHDPTERDVVEREFVEACCGKPCSVCYKTGDSQASNC